MIRVKELNGRMTAKGLTGKQMAEILKITPKTFYNKMKKGVFGTDEVEKMIVVLEIENPMDIFFAHDVT